MGTEMIVPPVAVNRVVQAAIRPRTLDALKRPHTHTRRRLSPSRSHARQWLAVWRPQPLADAPDGCFSFRPANSWFCGSLLFFGTIWPPARQARLPISRLVARKPLPRHAAAVLSEEGSGTVCPRAGSNFGTRNIGSTGLYVPFSRCIAVG
jgi:hypothetical protein